MQITKTVTIGKRPDEVYAFWRRLDQLPSFMGHLDRVAVTGRTTSHWVASAPLGRSVEWDAQIIEDTPGKRLGWRSVPGSELINAGTVKFEQAPGDRGTEVTARLEYQPPAGQPGAAVAKLFGEDPPQQLDDDLRRLKQILETGEVVRSDGAPGGKRAMSQRPAQPLSRAELAEVLG